jgi:electron transfer flavoprotein alpha subunit
MRILVAIEMRKGVVQPSSRELLSAARVLAGETGQVEALVLAAATVGLDLGSADVVLCASHPSFDRATAESYGRALEVVVAQRKPDAVLCGYTALGLDLAPGLAARTGLPLVAYCTALSPQGSAVKASSQIYGGKFVAETLTPLPAVFVVNPGSYLEAPLRPVETGQLVTVTLPENLDHEKIRFVSETVPDDDAVDLTKAERIVCVGRGIGDKDSIALAEEVADLLHAEIAGSRPVIDSGWLPKERQVGKSGRKVKPKLYFSVGVSGAPEHIEGMGGSDVIIAVNSDAAAPIFEVAHYAATCDLFDLLPALSERLKADAA